MRRIVSVLAGLTLAAAAFVPGPALAVAPESAFQVAIVADEGPAPVAGSVQTFYAVLTSGSDGSGDPVAGVPVTLTAKPYGATAFTAIGHTTTAADGSATVSAALQRSARIRWVFAGNAEHAATTSVDYLRTIGTKVAARALDRTLTRRQKVVVVGRSAPLKPGQRVSLWRGDVPCFCPNVSTTRIAVGRIRADGTFRLTARFANPGAKKLYVKVGAGTGNAPGYSMYVHVRVR